MAAVYPYQYKSFAQHRNLLDDVDASHVNNLQDEVAAIQATLGIAPQRDTGLKIKTNTWATVADRLDSIQRGQGIPVCYLRKDTMTMKAPKTSTASDKFPVAFPAPPAVYDPEGIFDGSSITPKRTGWWIVSGYARAGKFTDDPQRYIGLSINGTRVLAHDSVANFNGYSHTTFTWQGPVGAGHKMEMIARNPYKGKTYTLYEMKFSVAMLREM